MKTSLTKTNKQGKQEENNGLVLTEIVKGIYCGAPCVKGAQATLLRSWICFLFLIEEHILGFSSPKGQNRSCWKWQRSMTSVSATSPAARPAQTAPCPRTSPTPTLRLHRRAPTAKDPSSPVWARNWTPRMTTGSQLAYETPSLRSSRDTTGPWCPCPWEGTDLWRVNLTSRDPWMRSWFGRKRPAGSWRISIHTCTTPNWARLWGSCGGKETV